jgi:hypothetical protein
MHTHTQILWVDAQEERRRKTFLLGETPVRRQLFSAINVTWTGLRKNPGFRRNRPVINPLRQYMAHYINTTQLNPMNGGVGVGGGGGWAM